MKILASRFVIYSLVHRRDDGRGERLGDIADAEANDFRIWVRRLVGGDAMRNLREKIACLYLPVVFVYVYHKSFEFRVERVSSFKFQVSSFELRVSSMKVAIYRPRLFIQTATFYLLPFTSYLSLVSVFAQGGQEAVHRGEFYEE